MDTARQNRTRIITRLQAVIIGLMVAMQVCSQEVTVVVNPVQQVLPPQAGLYITNPGRFFTIQLFNNTSETQFVHLGLQIQQLFPNEGELWVSTNMNNGHIPRQPITIAPNQHKTLNAVEMRHLFDHFTSEDIFLKDNKYLHVTDGNFGLLPEGQYEAFITAYKWDTDLTSIDVLSNPKMGNCIFNICYEAEPPKFTFPVMTDLDGGFDPYKVVMVDKNDPSFEWLAPSLNCNAANVNFHHSIRFVELNNLEPDETMLPGTPTFHENLQVLGNRYTIPTAYVQQMIEPGKRKGKVYAVQVTATTDYFTQNPGSVNFTLLKNEGKSPILLFQLYDPNVEDDSYTLELEGTDSDLENEDSLYVFEQPLITHPAFTGKMGRLIYFGDDINAEWRKAWFVGGKGEEQDKVEFEYTVRLYTGNSADSYEDIIEAGNVIYEKKTNELKDTIKWDDIKEKISLGDYYILRVTAKSTNEESIRMLGDSLNYKDFAISQHFNETYKCGKSTAVVLNKNSITAKPDINTKLKIGEWTLSLDRDYEKVEFDKENKTLKGTGWITWTPGSVRARIAVKFEKLKVNTDYVVFEGECKTFAESSEKVEGTDCAVDELLEKFFDKEALDDIYGNLGLSEDVRQKVSQYITGKEEDDSDDGESEEESLAKGYSIGKYYSYYKLANKHVSSWKDGNYDLYFPMEAPDEIKQFLPDKFDVQIANMTFSPSSAVMNIIGEIVLPNSDIFDNQSVLVFGAPRLCIQPDRFFPEDGVLALLSNFPIKDPNSDFKLVFKAPTDPLNPKSNDGCFIRWENDEFDALGLEIAMTLPNTKRVVNGEVKDMPALLDLLATIESGGDACDFIATGTLTEFQVNDLPDWTFHVTDKIIFDHNLSDNGKGMPTYEQLTEKYPSNTFDPSLCGNYVESDWDAWQGVYVQNLQVEFPKFAVFGSQDHGLSIGAQDMIIDASGITCQVYTKDDLDAQTGSCGGWAFSIKTASVDIIQNNFDNCKFTGGFGVPLFGKKAEEKADKEAASQGKTSNNKKVEDYTDFNYTCEIRHLTDPKVEKYYTWNAEGKQKNVERTRKKYTDSRYAYLFRTEPVDDLQLNCFLATVDFSNYKAQNYFLVEARDKENESGQDVQVELCMAGDISIAAADAANERLKALSKKIADDKLKLQLPGIHFIKMRLANKPYDNWEDYGIGAAEIRNAAKEEQNKTIAEWKKSIINYNLVKGEEIELSKDECYFNLGEWSLASERKKLGPFSFNINKFSPKYENDILSLDIDGGIGLIGDKICVDGGIAISAKLHKEGSFQDWYLSDGDVDFKRLEVDIDFTALHLNGKLSVGKNKEGDSGYSGSLDIEITGLLTVNCAGGYYNHVATQADKQEMQKETEDSSTAVVDENYSWGYFLANVESGAGIPLGPVSINRISGGFYFNCKPTKGQGATKTSGNKFGGDPVAQYGMIGVTFGIGMSAVSGENTLKGDADLLVVYDRKHNCLTTFMLNGDVEAVGGIVRSEVTLVYENSKDNSGKTIERYLCLNMTLEQGFDNDRIMNKLKAANEYLTDMRTELDSFSDQLGSLVDKEVKVGAEQSLESLGEDYDPEKTAEKEAKMTDKEKAEAKKKEEVQTEHLGTSGSVVINLELKITWKDADKNDFYNTPRWHLYVGQPEKKKRCRISLLKFDSKICSAHIGADAYLCMGNELPDDGKLPEIPQKITEFLAGNKNANTDMGGDLSKAQNSRMNAAKALLNHNNINGGVMVGASAWGDITIDLGLLFGGIDAIAGFDASLINYGNSAFCVNNHSTMGYKGWYALGQFYAYLAANLGLHVKIGSLIDKKVNLLYAGIGGVLEMGLPKPTWIEGKARVKISLLGGLFNINRQFHFAAGDHCVPFRGNALDDFELFANVSMGSDSLYQALYQPEFAVSKADVSKMIITTNASLGSHHRLIDPSYVSQMAKDYYETEANDSIRGRLQLNASRTYVFDMRKDGNQNDMKMGVRLIDLGETTTTAMIEEHLTPEEFYERNGWKKKENTVYYAANAGVTEQSSSDRYDNFKSFVFAQYHERSSTVEECSSVMKGYELSYGEKELLHQKTNITEVIDYNLARGKYKFNGKQYNYNYTPLYNYDVEEKNVSFREDKGQTFHLCNMDVEEGHSYALILIGDAYEINSGHRTWCEYVDSTTMKEMPMKWRQNKIWFFRVKGKDEDKVEADSLSTLEPYVALAYPSVDGTKVKNNSNEPFTAYFGDIMHPTVALNRDLRDDLPKDHLNWILTAYDAKEFENNPIESCWSYTQTIKATYDDADNCFNLRPESDFSRVGKFTDALTQNQRQGRAYNFSNELYHLQLAYNYRPALRYKDGTVMKNPYRGSILRAEKDTVIYLVDMWVTAAPHDVMIDGMTGTQDDSWMQSTDREITGELLPYVVPFVGASPTSAPVFNYNFKNANGQTLTDSEIAFENYKYKFTDGKEAPYRLVDPWLYLSYLSKWTFIGGQKLNSYSFDNMYIPFASESLIYDFNGTIINSDGFLGEQSKSLITLRNEMYNTWNDWNFKNSMMPEWPLPITTKSVGGITAANQNGRASTVSPRILSVSKNDNSYSFAELAQDFVAPYNVAYYMSTKLKDVARTLWEKLIMGFYTLDFDRTVNTEIIRWNELHRGQYIEVSERGVTARVPYYQLPLIFGGCFGDNDSPTSTYWGRDMNALNRTFESSIAGNIYSGRKKGSSIYADRWYPELSNVVFFRLIGNEKLPDYDEYEPRTFQRPATSAYSPSFMSVNEVAFDQFNRSRAEKEVTGFKASSYRVDAYDVSTGLYHMKKRAASPWSEDFEIGVNSSIKNMGDMQSMIIDTEQDMLDYVDTTTPWAIWTESDKTLTLLYSDKNYSLEHNFNNKEITRVIKGDDVVKEYMWQQYFRDDLEKVVIDQSFSKIKLTSLGSWFTGCKKLKTITGLKYLDTEEVVSLWAMFRNCESLESIDLSSFDTRRVTNMSCMFEGCKNLKTVNLKGFNTAEVTGMYWMFKDCSQLSKLDLSTFSGDHVVKCFGMFSGCSSLKSLDISNFDADEMVKEYKNMFVDVTDDLVSYINIGLKEEIKDQIPGKKNMESKNVRAILAQNKDNKGILIFMNDPNMLKVGYSGDIKSTYETYRGLTVKKIYEGDQVLNTGSKAPGWAGDETIAKVIFDESFKYSPTSMYAWFKDCKNLTSIEIKGTLRTKNVKTMAYLFYGCANLESADFIARLNTQEVDNMSYMFGNCKKLEEINLLYYSMSSDEGNLFSTANVTNMSYMFQGCDNLKKINLGQNFNLGSVKNMSYMFSGCKNLVYLARENNLNTLEKASKLTNISYMFDGCESLKDENYFPEIIKMLNTSNVTDMSYMFNNCKSLTKLDLSRFSTEKLKKANGMFQGCSGLRKLDMSIFLASKASSLSSMFNDVPSNCYIFLPYNTNSSIHPAQVKKQTHPNLVLIYPTTVLLLQQASSTNRELVCLNTETKYTIGEKYNGMQILDVWSDTEVYAGHEGYSETSAPWSATTYAASREVVKITFTPEFKNIMPVNMHRWFSDMEKLETIVGMEYLNTSNATDMQYMFWNCKSLKDIDLSYFDTSEVEDMSYMFANCSSLRELDLSHFNTSKVKNMQGMFLDCSLLKHVNLSGFDTENVNNVLLMFAGCKSLNDLDLSSFNINNVGGFGWMFHDCSSLASLDLSSFHTSQKDMGSMFENCISLRSLTVGSEFVANEKFDDRFPTFGNVTKLKVYVPAEDLERVREEFTTNLGFVEGVTGKFLVIGEEEVEEKVAQVVWTKDNSTLTFCYLPALHVGESLGGAAVTKIWSGEDVTNSPESGDPKWSEVNPKTILIDQSFQEVKPKSMANWFAPSNGLIYIENVLNLEYVNTSEVVSMRNTFWSIDQSKVHIDFSKLDISKVKDITGMLPRVGIGGFIDLSTLDTRNVEKADYLFSQYHKAHVKVGPNFLFTKMKNKATGAFIRSESYKVNDLFVEVVGTANNTEFQNVKNAFKNKLGWVAENGRIKKPSEDVVQAVWTAGNKTLRFLKAPLYEANEESVNGYVVTNVWSGDDVVNSPSKSSPEWIATVSETLKSVVFDNSFATVTPSSMRNWFKGCSKLESFSPGKNLNTSKVTTMACMFWECSSLNISSWESSFSNFDTKQVTNMANMFRKCSSIKGLNLSNFSFEAVTNVNSMFYGCSSMTELRMSMPSMHNEVSMMSLFSGCEKLTSLPSGNSWKNIANWGRVTSIESMFKDCKSLKSLPTQDDGTVSLDVSNVTSTKSMFENCTSLTFGDSGILNLRGAGNVTNMDCMFKGCTSLEILDMSSRIYGHYPEAPKLTSAKEMFSGCTKLKKLSIAGDILFNANLQVSNAFDSVYYCYVYIYYSKLRTFDAAKDKLINKLGFLSGWTRNKNGTIYNGGNK